MRPWLKESVRFAPWVLALAVGFGYALRFDSTAGEGASAPAHWPTATRVSPAGLTQRGLGPAGRYGAPASLQWALALAARNTLS